MNKALWVGSLFVIALLVLVDFFPYTRVQGIKITRAESEISRNDRAELCRKLDKIHAAYNFDCDQILAEFFKDLENTVSPDFARAERAVPGVVKKMSGFRVCVKLCYKLAKDKLKKTNDFRDAYQDILNDPIIQPCLRANAAASGKLQLLEQRLRERSLRYAEEAASICSTPDLEGKLPDADLEHLQQCMDAFIADSQKLNVQKTVVAAAGAFEVIFIRQTCNSLMKLFAKPVFKICSSLGIAGICSVADGPLPIGDFAGGVITIGGLALTAWDLYDVTVAMPKKLRSELRNGIIQTKRELLKETRNQARKIVDAYHQSGNSLHAQLKQKL